MIAGQVNALLESYVRLKVRGPGGLEVEVEARVDTAFDGELTLEPATVAALNLTPVRTIRATLGDGSIVSMPVYAATVLWERNARAIESECTPGHCLLGTGLLDRHDLRIRFVSGGGVEIEAIP